MKPRKDQTEEQRIIRDMGVLMLKYMKDDGDKSLELKKLWKICPHGYKNFTAFYKKVLRLASKSVTS